MYSFLKRGSYVQSCIGRLDSPYKANFHIQAYLQPRHISTDFHPCALPSFRLPFPFAAYNLLSSSICDFMVARGVELVLLHVLMNGMLGTVNITSVHVHGLQRKWVTLFTDLALANMGNSFAVHLEPPTVRLRLGPLQRHVGCALDALADVVKTVAGMRVESLSVDLVNDAVIVVENSVHQPPVVAADQSQAV